MRRRNTFSFNIRHYASISFDAHFKCSWEQIVTSLVLLIFLGAFIYPMALDGGGGAVFWMLCCAALVIILSVLFDLYWAMHHLLRMPNKTALILK